MQISVSVFTPTTLSLIVSAPFSYESWYQKDVTLQFVKQDALTRTCYLTKYSISCAVRMPAIVYSEISRLKESLSWFWSLTHFSLSVDITLHFNLARFVLRRKRIRRWMIQLELEGFSFVWQCIQSYGLLPLLLQRVS